MLLHSRLYLGERSTQFIVAIPPLNEQKLMVAKVDQLMQLCDELEEKLKQSQKAAERLMKAVLQEAFGNSSSIG